MNYLFLLPDELINLILEKCAEDSINNSIHDNYIKFQYNFSYNSHQNFLNTINKITRKYSEYTGIIQNGIPIRKQEIIQGTAYLEHIPKQFNNILLNWYQDLNVEQNLVALTRKRVQVIETKWLYTPLLYVLKNYQLRFSMLNN